MSESENKKINKREYWQDQIKCWQESSLSQSAFCTKSAINLSTFVYWRGLLRERDNKNINKKFLPINVIKNNSANDPIQEIKIKLLTGHMVYLPVGMGINEIAKLIHLLGLPHA